MIYDGTSHQFNDGSYLAQNTWQHISWVYVDGVLKIYINGVLDMDFPIVADTTNYFENVIIGNLIFNITNRAFIGRINDFRFYDHALSQKEINDLAKAKVLHYTFNRDDALVMDASGYKRHGIKNGTTYTQGKLGSGAYSFNGSTDAITRPMLDALGYQSFTTNVWCYFNQTNTRDVIFGTFHGTNLESFNVEKHTANRLRIYWQGAPDIFSANNALPIKEWCMVTVVRNKENNTLKMYVNGNLVVNQSVSISDINTFNNRTLYIGRDIRTTYQAMNGLIDDLSFYTTALSDEDILDLYQTRVKFDDAGNVYANEFVEDYEVADGLTLTQLFSNNGVINGDFSLSSNWSAVSGATHVYENNKLKITGSTQHGGVQQCTVPIINGRTYYFVVGSIESNVNFYIETSNPYNTRGYNASSKMASKISTANSTGSMCVYPFRANQAISFESYIDNVGNYDITDLITKLGYTPTTDQMDAWYRDYSRVRPNAKGQMIAHELNEVGIDTIVYEGKSYRDIFETGNLLVNGDFEDGLDGWTARSTPPVVVDGVLTYTSASASSDIYRGGGLSINKDYFISYEYSLTQGTIFSRQGSADNTNSIDVTTAGSGIFSKVYATTTTNSNFIIGSGETGTTCTIDNIKIIKLTDDFTTQPTQEQMDAWYNIYRQLKLTTQQQRITKDTLVINGEFKEV
jgi:hypothetical protein